MRSEYQAEVDRLQKLIERYLFIKLPKVYKETDEEAGVLQEAMRYTLGLPGKRTRPVLLMLAYKAAGGVDEDFAIPFACAVEYIHTYSLIHDDLPAIDDDGLRRGKPANHKVYGEAMAILAGDALLSAAFEVMAVDCYHTLCDPEYSGIQRGNLFELRELAGAKLEASRIIARACGSTGMVAGQAADITVEGKEVSEGLLKYIHFKKTAELFRASVQAGAALGGLDGNALEMFGDYGHCLGLAYQITDDILDAEGKTEDIGKTAGKDQKVRKATYPAVYGIETSREELKRMTAEAGKAIWLARAEIKTEDAEGIFEPSNMVDNYYAEILVEFASDLAERIR